MILFFVVWIVVFLVGALMLQGRYTKSESIQESMRDAVLHETNKISLFGIKDVNPAAISGFTVTGILLLLALTNVLFSLFSAEELIRILDLDVHCILRYRLRCYSFILIVFKTCDLV